MRATELDDEDIDHLREVLRDMRNVKDLRDALSYSEEYTDIGRVLLCLDGEVVRNGRLVGNFNVDGDESDPNYLTWKPAEKCDPMVEVGDGQS